MEKKINIIINGMNSSGKKTLIKYINENFINKINIIECNLLKENFNKYWDEWPKTLNINYDFLFILECSPDICIKERNSKILSQNLFYQRYKYRQFAAFYSAHLIDNSFLSIENLQKIIIDIIFNNNIEYFIPKIDNMTNEEFNKLPLVIDTNSKIVKKYNNKYHIIQLKPTVYSFIKKGINIIEGTDIERLILTKNIIELISRYEIPHSYYYVGNNLIITKSLYNDIDIPPIETIVKRYYIGSDKHNYYNLNKCYNRFGKPMTNNNYEYNKLLVRFDYRNPNINPDTNLPLGDLPLCDDLADEFLNSEIAKKTAKKCFNVLDEHFSKMNLYFEDVCFMLDVNGDTMYGEVSQDCGRYKYLNNGEIVDLDKDVWRNWESFENVREKYKRIREMIEKFVKEEFYDMK
jgi:phosphoribosylaminoimidazole-succinocarboxamide synthase